MAVSTRTLRMKSPTMLLLAVTAAGCETLPPAEAVWQTAHLIDTAQTMQIAKNPECYHEKNPITRSLIGKHPSEEAVVAWGIGMAVAHYQVTRLLTRYEAPRWVQWGWQAVSIGSTGAAVVNNHEIGLRPFGTDCP